MRLSQMGTTSSIQNQTPALRTPRRTIKARPRPPKTRVAPMMSRAVPQMKAIPLGTLSTIGIGTALVGWQIKNLLGQNGQILKNAEPEIDIKALKGGGQLGATWDLPQGGHLNLKVKERAVDFQETAWHETATPDAILKQWEQQWGAPPEWKETEGVIESKTQLDGRLSPQDLSIAARIKYANLIRYRLQRPIEPGTVPKLKETFKSMYGSLPITPEAALKMPLGTVLEIKGHQALNPRADIEASRNIAGPGFTAGPTLNLGGDLDKADEISVKVYALNGRGLVQVTIENLNKAGLNFQARLASKLKLMRPPKDSSLSVLKSLLDQGLEQDLLKTLEEKAQAEFKLTHKQTDETSQSRSYLLDLSDKSTHDTYRRLLDFSESEAEDATQDFSKAIQGLDTHERTKEAATEFKFGEKSLLLREALNSNQTITQKSAEGGIDLYRHHKFRKHYRNWLTGSKTISWETVSLKKSGKSQGEYFNLKLHGLDQYTTPAEVRQYFILSHLLGIDPDGPTKQELPSMGIFEKIYSDRDDCSFNLDLYITEDGIAKVNQATRTEATIASLKSQVAFDPSLKGLETLAPSILYEAIDLARDYDAAGPAGCHSFMDEMAGELEDQYARLTQRDLEQDYEALVAAGDFAKKIKTINSKGQRGGADFFHKLGGLRGFRFMPTLGGLAQMVGHEEIIVQEMSMEGNGVRLKSVSEGTIERPNAMAVGMVQRS